MKSTSVKILFSFHKIRFKFGKHRLLWMSLIEKPEKRLNSQSINVKSMEMPYTAKLVNPFLKFKHELINN